MNFLHILRKFGFIFFILSFIPLPAKSLSDSHFQELGQPHVKVYHLPDPYHYVNRYNSIVQDKDGFLYIGSNNGVLRFDGATWNHIPGSGEVTVLTDGSKVYTSSGEGVGYLNRGPEGSPAIKNLVPAETLPAEINQSVFAENYMYLLTDSTLLCWQDELKKVDLSFLPEAIFVDGNSLLLYSPYRGLMRYEENQPVTIFPADVIPLEKISAIQRSGNQWLLVDGSSGTSVVLNSETFEAVPGKIDPVLISSVFSCKQALSDGNIAWGTLRAGILVSDIRGNIIYSIDRDDGLYDNRVKALFTDSSGNLWALHDHGLSRMEIPTAFTFYGSNRGLQGNIRDLLRFDGTMYAAGNQGLFSLDAFPSIIPGLPDEYRFAPVEDIPYDCRQLSHTKETILAATLQGVFELGKHQVRRILDRPVNVLHYSARNDAILAATDTEVLYLAGPEWSDPVSLSIPESHIREIYETDDGYIWLASYTGQIFISEQLPGRGGPPVFNRIESDLFSGTVPLDIRFFSFSGNLCMAYDGIYTYDPDTGGFIRDSLVDLTGITEKSHIREITGDHEGNLWISTQGSGTGPNEVYFTRQEGKNEYKLHNINYRRFNTQIINCIYPDTDGIVWIGSHSGLTRFDPASAGLVRPGFPAHIAEVNLPEDSTLTYDYILSDGFLKDHKNGLVRIPHSKNRIQFHYLSTDFNSESMPLFQYKITGLQETWSDWSENSLVRFDGLASGTYEFTVRSMDIFGSLSASDSFRFRVMPPFYSSIFAMLFYIMLFLLFLYAFRKWRTFRNVRERYRLEEIIRERTEALVKEKEETENLLANILPRKTAEELKLKGKATSSKFKMVTVLFADIQGFTKIAEQMNPDKLIDELDRFYFHFDTVVGKYNIEKIKTIGDAYMAAGGIPVKNRTNPVEVVLAALEMQHYMHELKKTKTDIWDLRIGIHTGSVIAGVVGQKKFSYDIWGDAVNTASRMESSGEIGKVNVSTTTHELVKDFFDCEYRGKMPVKYKGDIEMYFVIGLKDEFLLENKTGPNERFRTRIQLLRLLDLEEYILQRLDKELPENLFFHNTEHTAHVYTQVELLGRGEHVSEEDLLMLRTAALLHDTGYIDKFDEHEERSVELAREILPVYRYSDEQVDRVCDLILSTRLPFQPAGLLEKIMADANLDHLGRVDFLIQSDKLFQEYRVRGKIKTKKDWNQYQIDFIEKHDFFTEIADKLREVTKEQQIENIRQFS